MNLDRDAPIPYYITSVISASGLKTHQEGRQPNMLITASIKHHKIFSE